jgi:crotonobetainyl-CoA:carnitine CoA-transferase CaiB-like acyl-CoA transferase
MSAAGPLDGIEVVEIGVAMAAPFCGMMLGDYGADVVKIERVGVGDDSRTWPPYFYDSMSHYFAAANRNKRSIALDLKTPDGAEIARRLVARADVLVENYRVGALDRAGLGYAEMSARNERLVYCSISGFGREGPRRDERANDLMMQAFAGSMSVTGEVGGDPVRMGVSIADIGAGLFATIGILGALEARHRTGRGQFVSTSLLEGQLAILSYQLTNYFSTGIAPEPLGTGGGVGVPYQAFPTADSWLIVAAFNQVMWRAFCEAVERTDWTDDPRFVDLDHRAAHREELVALIADVLRTKTSAEWEAIFKAHGVPHGRVNRIDEVVAEPQVADTGMLADIDVPTLGPIRVAGPPVGLSETPPRAQHGPPPRLGEHTRAVLRELDYSDRDVDALVGAGVVGVAPADATTGG